jgi:hypothetical protein
MHFVCTIHNELSRSALRIIEDEEQQKNYVVDPPPTVSIVVSGDVQLGVEEMFEYQVRP